MVIAHKKKKTKAFHIAVRVKRAIMQIKVRVQLQNKTTSQSKSNSKASNNRSALANNDSDYEEDQFEEVNNANGLYDYKQQYMNNNDYTPSNPADKLRKPSFLNKQSKANNAYNKITKYI